MTKHKKSRINRAVSAVVETLEGRRLLAATVAVELTSMSGLGAVLSDTTGDQQTPVVAYNGGVGVAAWADDSAGNTDIWARTFDSTGTWITDPFRVNTTTTGAQTSPDVAVADNGSFTVVWNDTSVTPNAIKARQYDNTGTASGGELTASTDTSNDKTAPHIGMAGNGNFVVTWDSNGQDGGGFGVYGQRYSAAGSTQGAEVTVNTTTTGDQISNQVAMADDGSFTVAFVSDDTGGTGIWFQRFDNTGAATGSETGANATTTGAQASPDIAMEGTGEFTIAWTSAGQDGAGNGVYFQKFNANGTVAVAEAQGNTTTSGNQDLSSVTMADNGTFVVSFVDASTGTPRAIARRFDSSGSAISEESVVTSNVDSGTQPGIAIVSTTRFVATTVSHNTDDDVTVTLLNSTLHATADAAGSTISVSASGGNVTVTADGNPTVVDENDVDALLVTGSAAADTITFASALPGSLLELTVNGLAGNDTIAGGDGAESINGGNGNDRIQAGAGADSITGGDGNDTIDAGDDDDRVDPGAGDDDADGGAGTDTWTYQSRSEDLTVRIDGQSSGATGESDAADNFENAVGGSGNDLVIGDANNNILGGADGNDTLDAGAGNDTIFGDNGSDTVSYESHAAAVTIDLANATGGATLESDSLHTIENAIGGSGNDTIVSGAYDNVINGGDGVDTVSYTGRTNALTIALDGTATSGETGETDTLGTDVENAIGGAGADSIVGNSSANNLYGGAGNDTIQGLDGNDVLTGSTGNDVFFGGLGNDAVYGNAGNDTVDGGNGADVIYGQAGTDDIFAGAGRDRVFGGTEDDRVKGGSGNDTLNGEAGADKMYGDTGNDSMSGGDGADYMLGGSGTDNMSGGNEIDKLFGETGSDTLAGGAGADRIDGGLSTDTVDADQIDKLFSVEVNV
jgi:Ca2+-binding RTX toxin-like protein